MGNNQEKKRRLNIAVIGPLCSGKTSVISQYKNNSFDKNYKPTFKGGHIEINKKITIEDTIVNIPLTLTDKSGMERDAGLTKGSVRNSQGVVIVVDATNKERYKDLDRFIDYVSDINKEKNLPAILLDNSREGEERVVIKEELQDIAEKNNMKLYEVSTKTGNGIQEAIDNLIKDVYIQNKERFNKEK